MLPELPVLCQSARAQARVSGGIISPKGLILSCEAKLPCSQASLEPSLSFLVQAALQGTFQSINPCTKDTSLWSLLVPLPPPSVNTPS